MRRVRLFNLTDVETPTLKEKGQVGIVVAGRGFSIEPGESCEVSMTASNLQAIQSAVSAGLLAVDSLPTAYILQKSRAAKPRRKR